MCSVAGLCSNVERMTNAENKAALHEGAEIIVGWPRRKDKGMTPSLSHYTRRSRVNSSIVTVVSSPSGRVMIITSL